MGGPFVPRATDRADSDSNRTRTRQEHVSAVHARASPKRLAASEHDRVSCGACLNAVCAVLHARAARLKMWGWFGIALPSVIVCVTLIVRVRSARRAATSASRLATARHVEGASAESAATRLSQNLSAPSVTHFVKADVGFGWGVALFVVALVPADVVLVRERLVPAAQRTARRAAPLASALRLHCTRASAALTAGGTAAQTMANEDSRALLNLYAIPYWATQILTWLVLPLHQLYADAGDFTVRARLRTSVRENGLFYVVLGILGLIVMIVLVITKGISVGGIVSGAVAFSLSFSIATGVFLMGYGFSEIPRVCWLRSSLSGRKRWCARYMLYSRAACSAKLVPNCRCEHRVGQLSDKLEAEYTELSKLVWSAEQMSNTMPRRHHLRWAMDVIDESIKKSAVPGAPPDAENKDEDDYDYEDIHVCLPSEPPFIGSSLTCAIGLLRRWRRCGDALIVQLAPLIASSMSTCTRSARP